MGLLNIFSGKDPEAFEQKGDILFEKGEYGTAKLEYEAGLSKLEKKFPERDDLKSRLQQKIIQTKNALAFLHRKCGNELLESGNYRDAEEKFRLAIELAEDPELQVELEERIQEIEKQLAADVEDYPDFELQAEDTEEPDYQERLDEYFAALTSSLPGERMELYQNYGNDFKVGYVALNQGDFEYAKAKLSVAVKENPAPDNSYIALELAKAYFNLKQCEEARSLLDGFLKDHPDSLEGYQLLCEVYWEMGEFDQAQELLSSSPEELRDSLPVQLLRGETLSRAERYEEAESCYLNYLETFGWDEHVARMLAVTYETMGKKERARELFGDIMEECHGCGFRIDPFVKQRYADLHFEAGQYSTKVLELYISLVHEDPMNRLNYYRKISRIYSVQGNEREARRYQLFAQKLEGKEQNNDEDKDTETSAYDPPDDIND
ncbi:MAG: tetratricopeptide repeat protein [bacterium]